MADWLAAGVAASLPWSTSATSVFAALWVVAVIPTLDWRELRAVVRTPAGGLPVLLVLLGALGMLWADVSLAERWDGVGSFFKLLAIPLLLVQFQKSDRGLYVLGAFLVSCTALMVISMLVVSVPLLSFIPLRGGNTIVRNAPSQSGEFVACIFVLAYLAVDFYERRRWPWLIAAVAVILGMLANISYVSTGRTALATIPVLLMLFAFRRLRAKGIVLVMVGAVVIGAIVWSSSSYLRTRTVDVWNEMQRYEASAEQNSSGERLEFWKKSIAFMREAPLIGHGTGSIHALFIQSAIGKTGAPGSATTNPHHQTFAVGIQLGLAGVLVLWAMWISHALLFRNPGLAEWIGLVVVAQNVVGSLFNSHLFDFLQGWIYVFGVGVAGGIALKNRAARAPPAGEQALEGQGTDLRPVAKA